MTKENKNKTPSIMEDKDFMDFLTGKFGSIDDRFERIEDDISAMKSDISGLKSDTSEMKSDIGYLKNNMVTKDYLDRKLADLEGRIILIIKRGDEKFNLLVEVLLDKKVISKQDVNKINSIEVFTTLK